ncbi:hypothetical protein [Mycobacterium sp. HNNTM2301]|uniref:hypothetical protein n=1 Tax=Mycobacterium hainanense TaxID=3289775 RepID=UPI0035A5D202
MVGLLPYLPLPTKRITAVMPEMIAGAEESPDVFAERARPAMQARLDALTARRTPLLG